MEQLSTVIRPLADTDLDAAMDLVWQVFSQFEAPDYSPEGVEEFRRFIQPAEIRRWQSKGMELWACFDGKAVVGVVAMRPPAHVSLLFVHRDYHRRGIARRLYAAAIERCKESVVTVNSSPYAREVYRRLGFAETGEEQTVNGIRFIPMIHQLPEKE